MGIELPSPDDVWKHTVAAPTNMHGSDFPRVDKDNRAYFRCYAPDVKRCRQTSAARSMRWQWTSTAGGA